MIFKTYFNIILFQQMLDFLLAENIQYWFPIGSIVHVATGKQLIDDTFHFLITQHLPMGDGCTSCKA